MPTELIIGLTVAVISIVLAYLALLREMGVFKKKEDAFLRIPERNQEKITQEAKGRINRYPIKQMSQGEFDNLPDSHEGLGPGQWFKCKPSKLCPEVKVVGHLVESFDDMFADQVGGAVLSFPKPYFNRYRVEIT